jgi:hypothetical protein
MEIGEIGDEIADGDILKFLSKWIYNTKNVPGCSSHHQPKNQNCLDVRRDTWQLLQSISS